MGLVPQLLFLFFGEVCLMAKKVHKTPATHARPSQVRPKATTRDVVSAPRRRVKINPKWESNYRHLQELRNHFLRQQGTLAQEAHEEQPSFSEHMADAGTDSYDRDFALSMLSSDQNALYEIDQAIRRIESGAYGICEMTGKPIQRGRLNAIPWTRFSLEAEMQLEQRGAVNRARLGPLGSVTSSTPSEEEPPEKESADNSGNDNNS
ncbi:MAG: yocK [Pedosphaera sp.]|nr:yocK [Pedosphaera sp.]